MKTKEQWDSSRMDFGEFINTEDEIDEELYNYFLCFMPPTLRMHYGFLSGEPYTINNDGKFLYDSFYVSPDKKQFFYGGLRTIKGFIKEGTEPWQRK